MYDRPTPLLQLTMPRASRTLKDLRSQIWEDPLPVRVSYSGPLAEAVQVEEAEGFDYQPVELPFHWGRLFKTGWFKLDLPEYTDTRWLHWQDQGEGTLILDGEHWYGFDVAHHHAPLPEGCRQALIEGLCLQSGIWHPEAKGLDAQGSRLDTASLVRRNEDAWHAVIDLEILIDLVKNEAGQDPHFGGAVHEGGIGYHPPINVVTPLTRNLLRLLDNAVNAYATGGLAAIRQCLEEGRAELAGGDRLCRNLLTGHAHIDLVWLWNEASGDYKARHTFSTMNRLMETYPEFRFAYSQSASYDAVERMAPRLMEQVRSRVKEGKWEHVGSTYVESDTLMACGEALARSFLVGQDRFRHHFGDASRLLWLPDVFGYCGCLPQIMRECNVDRFFTTKLTWCNVNLFPYSAFIWRGTDGSEILTYISQGHGYNQIGTPTEARVATHHQRQSDLYPAALQPTGYGDGGGGVTPEMCERARRMNDLAGVPQTAWTRLEDFYDELETKADQLPVYQGELYLEYHHGTLTSHGNLKRDFRGLERALQLQEAAAALTGAGPVDPHAWQRLVFAQFHDYIPGSSVYEVYEEALPELQNLAEEAISEAHRLLGEDDAMANLLPLTRKVTRGDHVLTLPPAGVFRTSEVGATEVSELRKEALLLSSDRVTARFTDTGEVAELIVDGETLQTNGSLNRLCLYDDFPHAFDAWEIDRGTLHLGREVDTPVEPVEWEPDVGVGLAFKRALGTNSTVEIRYWIDPAQPVLQVELLLDWHEQHTLLKACFDTHYLGRDARYGSPFNSILRPQLPGPTHAEAMFENAGSRWASVLDDARGEGLFVVTRDKFAFSCREGTLSLSLVRSPQVTGEDPGHAKVVVKSLRDGPEREPFTDQGEHRITYALGRSRYDQVREEHPAALADLLYTPLLSGTPIQGPFLGLEGGESLIPAWIQPLENGEFVVRLHEVEGKSGTARLLLADDASASLQRIDGTPLEGEATTLSFRPYQILSVRITC